MEGKVEGTLGRNLLRGLLAILSDVCIKAGILSAGLSVLAAADILASQPSTWALLAAELWGAAAVLGSATMLLSASFSGLTSWSDTAVAAGWGGAVTRVVTIVSTACLWCGLLVCLAAHHLVPGLILLGVGLGMRAVQPCWEMAAVSVVSAGTWHHLPMLLAHSLRGPVLRKIVLRWAISAARMLGLLVALVVGVSGSPAAAVVIVLGTWVWTARIQRRLSDSALELLSQRLRAVAGKDGG